MLHSCSSNNIRTLDMQGYMVGAWNGQAHARECVVVDRIQLVKLCMDNRKSCQPVYSAPKLWRKEEVQSCLANSLGCQPQMTCHGLVIIGRCFVFEDCKSLTQSCKSSAKLFLPLASCWSLLTCSCRKYQRTQYCVSCYFWVDQTDLKSSASGLWANRACTIIHNIHFPFIVPVTFMSVAKLYKLFQGLGWCLAILANAQGLRMHIGSLESPEKPCWLEI